MENHVREVFLKHLAASNDANEAAAESYRELNEEALACAYEGRVVEKPVWDLLVKIIRALARVKLYSVYYDKFPDFDSVSFEPRHFTDISMFFQTWRDVVAFVVEYYDQVMSQRFKAAATAEDLRKFVLTGIDKQIGAQSEQIANENLVTIGRQEFRTMVKGLSWGISVILGKEDHKKFVREFEKRRVFLEKYYLMAAAPPPGSSRPM